MTCFFLLARENLLHKNPSNKTEAKAGAAENFTRHQQIPDKKKINKRMKLQQLGKNGR
jgi:hypothetical protein